MPKPKARHDFPLTTTTYIPWCMCVGLGGVWEWTGVQRFHWFLIANDRRVELSAEAMQVLSS